MKFIFNMADAGCSLFILDDCAGRPVRDRAAGGINLAAAGERGAGGKRGVGANEADPPSDPPPDDSVETMFPHLKDTRFWLSGQMNFIFQTHPPFPAPYSGPNSLRPDYEKATSRVLTLYTGVRLNDSTEILADMEEAGGQALSPGLGLAGNTDLDIVRNPIEQSALSGAGHDSQSICLEQG